MRASHLGFGRAPRGVLIDCGNTILGPSVDVVERVLSVYGLGSWGPVLTQSLGLVADLHSISLPGDDSREPFYEWWRRLSGVPDTVTEAHLREITSQPDLYSDLNSGAAACLSELHRAGIRIAVVANAEGQTHEEMDVYGLSNFIHTTVDSTTVGVRKPEREIYEEASRQIGLPLSDCWFIGDALFNDVLGPMQAGIGHALLYDPRRLFARTPVDRISSLEELVERALGSRGQTTE